jgi:hypothetical protein
VTLMRPVGIFIHGPSPSGETTNKSQAKPYHTILYEAFGLALYVCYANNPETCEQYVRCNALRPVLVPLPRHVTETQAGACLLCSVPCTLPAPRWERAEMTCSE